MRRGLTALGVALAVVLSLWAGTYENDQPVWYHPDEPGKVGQLLSGRWNFNHPQAMLTVTRWVTWVVGPDLPVDGENVDRSTLDADVVAQRGRLASALFAALATAALAGAAWLLHGRRAAVIVGLLVAICPALVLRAHYMKEDTALVAGLAVIALGLAAIGRRWRWPGAVTLGLGMGLAASGKYIGIAPAVLALPLPLAMRGAGRWWLRPAVVVLAAAVGLGVWAGLNHEKYNAPQRFEEGWDREWEHAFVDGHTGLYPPAWGTFFLDAIQYEVPWAVLGAAGAAAVWTFTVGRRSGVATWTLTLFPLGYYVLLMPSAIGFNRYALPIMVGLTYLAGVGVAVWPGRIRRTAWRWGLTVVLAAAVLTPSAMRTAEYLHGFRDDSRDRLRQWVQEELPRGTRIAQEAYAGLQGRDVASAGVRVRSWDTPMNQSIDELRRRRFTHVIIASPRYFRYLDGTLRAMPGEERAIANIKANYAQLFAQGKLVWQSGEGRGTPGYTNPIIRVYDIRE